MMYLNWWMILILVTAFGYCALSSYKMGLKAGVVNGIWTTLDKLNADRVITITEKGRIVPYNYEEN